jgi:hypothetical protein
MSVSDAGSTVDAPAPTDGPADAVSNERGASRPFMSMQSDEARYIGPGVSDPRERE